MEKCSVCGKPNAVVRASKVEQVLDFCEYCWRIWRRKWQDDDLT